MINVCTDIWKKGPGMSDGNDLYIISVCKWVENQTKLANLLTGRKRATKLFRPKP